MGILFRWNLRMIRENPLHTLFTVLNLVFNYALMTLLKLVTRGQIVAENTDGDAMLWYLALILALVIFVTSLLTMYNLFSVTIRERRRRYQLFFATGATRRQLRSALFLEALLINCVGAVLGIAAGAAAYALTEGKMDWQLLLNNFIASNAEEFDGSFYIQTPQRVALFLLPEFLTVPTAMAMAAGRYLPGSRRKAKQQRPVVYANELPFHRMKHRLYGAGGVLNRLMDRREGLRRRFVSSTIVVVAFIAVIAVISMDMFGNTLSLIASSRLSDVLVLRTEGDNAAGDDVSKAQHLAVVQMDQRLGDFLISPEFEDLTAKAYWYRIYTPRVCCMSEDAQINTRLATPRMIFLNDANYQTLLKSSGATQDVDAILLPCEKEGKDVAWVSGSGVQSWTLDFYDGEERFVVYDDDMKKEKAAAEKEKAAAKNGTNAETDSYKKTTVNYDCTNANELFKKVKKLTAADNGKDKSKNVNVVNLSSQEKLDRIQELQKDISILEKRLDRFQQKLEKIQDKLNKMEGKPKPNQKKLEKTRAELEKEQEEWEHLQQEQDKDWAEWNKLKPIQDELDNLQEEDRSWPILVFRESDRKEYEGLLEGANQGIHLRAKLKENEGAKENEKKDDQLLVCLRNVIFNNPDSDDAEMQLNGCVAEHIYALGTRYSCRKDREASDQKKLEFPLLRTIFYKAPHPIYADLYPKYHGSNTGSFFSLMAIALILMLYTLLTNSINTVYGHHTLRKHDYAVLQSCGLSEGQTQRALLYEAAWYSTRTIVFGCIGGLLLMPLCVMALQLCKMYERKSVGIFLLLQEWFSEISVSRPKLWADYNSPLAVLRRLLMGSGYDDPSAEPGLLEEMLESIKNVFTSLVPVFLLLGVVLFFLLLLMNVKMLRRMHKETLISQLKKDK